MFMIFPMMAIIILTAILFIIWMMSGKLLKKENGSQLINIIQLTSLTPFFILSSSQSPSSQSIN